jgi:hypothetical protein
VARNLDDGGRGARSSTSDLELCARQVELRWRSRVVNTELLDAEKVLSSRDLARNCDRVGGYVTLVFFEHVYATVYIQLKSHLACPEEKSGPISLILNQSPEPSADAALETLLM